MERGVSDDLESLFWILLYLILRYRPIATLTAVDVRTILKKLFDDMYTAGSGQDRLVIRGGVNKYHFLADGHVGFTDIFATLAPSVPVPILATFTELFRLFRSSYAPGLTLESERTQQSMIVARDTAQARLTTHQSVMSLVLAGVEHAGWAQVSDGGGEDQIARLVEAD